jgi:hypothetical protein
MPRVPSAASNQSVLHIHEFDLTGRIYEDRISLDTAISLNPLPIITIAY